jgi:hypothetical protein
MEEIMTVNDIKDFSDVLIFLSAIIRVIIIWPFRCIAIILAIPNAKIVYRSGHVEYYFFRSINAKHNGGKVTSLEWDSVTLRKPMIINIDEIESIHQLY